MSLSEHSKAELLKTLEYLMWKETQAEVSHG